MFIGHNNYIFRALHGKISKVRLLTCALRRRHLKKKKFFYKILRGPYRSPYTMSKLDLKCKISNRSTLMYTHLSSIINESLKASVELAARELHGVELSLLKSTRIEGSRTKQKRKKMINESSFFVK